MLTVQVAPAQAAYPNGLLLALVHSGRLELPLHGAMVTWDGHHHQCITHTHCVMTWGYSCYAMGDYGEIMVVFGGKLGDNDDSMMINR